MKNIVSIRGAITISKNDAKEIKNAVIQLLKVLFKQNKLNKLKIVNMFFTATHDIDAINPATIARREFKLESVPMLCLQEMKVKNGLKKCIRIMLNVYSDTSRNTIKHVYLGRAESLRPDLNF